MKWMKKVAALLAVVGLLTSTVMASSGSQTGAYIINKTDGYTLEMEDEAGQTITAQTGTVEDGTAVAEFYVDAQQLQVEVSNVVDGANYVILMFTGQEVTVNSILYLDQIQAKDGSLIFQVYPKNMDDATIWITSDAEGFASPAQVATIGYYRAYELGDVTEDGKITTGDAVAVLQYVVGSRELSAAQKIAADVNHSNTITTGDAVAILQYIVSGTPFNGGVSR